MQQETFDTLMGQHHILSQEFRILRQRITEELIKFEKDNRDALLWTVNNVSDFNKEHDRSGKPPALQNRQT